MKKVISKNNADNHKWLAEFALGYMNDAIQQQYMGGKMLAVVVFKGYDVLFFNKH